MPTRLLSKYFRCTIESVLNGCNHCLVRVIPPSTTARPSSVVKTAQYITGTMLLPIQDIYLKRCLKKPRSIIKDTTHHSEELFTPL
jgi:hypothetical protein